MNIFVLHREPEIAAQMVCDSHCVKMVLESAQMLATVQHQFGGHALYRPTHESHPCTRWAGYSSGNYEWLLRHAKALCEEYTYRYGRRHKTQAYIDGELSILPPKLPQRKLTKFAQAMPAECKHDDAVIAYRRYYITHKTDMARWKYRDAPAWFTYQTPELEV